MVLTGMEAHVCVAQTAMDLIEAGFTVFLPHVIIEDTPKSTVVS